jgi:RimJ/RimL family protein N-acetyltransferase
MTTDRLAVRYWLESDRDPFAAMNADPRVRAHFPALLMRFQSDGALNRYAGAITDNGYGMWALEKRSDKRFIGFTGLQRIDFDAPIGGDIEIGWCLARSAWGQGFASEAAIVALGFAWARLDCPRIVAATVPGNARSIAVMERIGMVRRPELDFDHPEIAVGHPLRHNIVHAIDRPA